MNAPSEWLYAEAVQVTVAPSSAALGVHVTVAFVALKLLAPPADTEPNELLALPHIDELHVPMAEGAGVAVAAAVIDGALVDVLVFELLLLALLLDLVNASAGGGLPPEDEHSSVALVPSVNCASLGTGVIDGLPGGATSDSCSKQFTFTVNAVQLCEWVYQQQKQ